LSAAEAELVPPYFPQPLLSILKPVAIAGNAWITDTNKLIAAIWVASMYHGTPASYEDYFNVFDRFLDMMKQREEERASSGVV
jgi:hypothetical protein